MIRAQQNLKFLQRVVVRGWASIGYDEKGNRDIEREAWSEPRLAHVIGKVRKALGTYYPAKRVYGLDGAEDLPACLVAKEYIELWEVKPSLTAKSYLVHDEDLEPCPSHKTLSCPAPTPTKQPSKRTR